MADSIDLADVLKRPLSDDEQAYLATIERQSDEAEDDVRRRLQDMGVQVDDDVDIRVLSGGGVIAGLEELPWTLIIAAPGAWLASQFFGAIVKSAGEDVYKKLRPLIARLRIGRSESVPNTLLIQSQTKATFHLDRTLPKDAYRALFSIDWATVEGGNWEYSRQQCKWVQRDRNDWLNGRSLRG
jgi:hypothetical protein